MKIWKFPLEITDSQLVSMPFHSQIICIQSQQGVVTLWALVDPTSPAREKKICICGTGNDAPYGINYLGTAQTHGGEFVWHVFDLGWK
jgi:hypothetical protein